MPLGDGSAQSAQLLEGQFKQLPVPFRRPVCLEQFPAHAPDLLREVLESETLRLGALLRRRSDLQLGALLNGGGLVLRLAPSASCVRNSDPQIEPFLTRRGARRRGAFLGRHIAWGCGAHLIRRGQRRWGAPRGRRDRRRDRAFLTRSTRFAPGPGPALRAPASLPRRGPGGLAAATVV